MNQEELLAERYGQKKPNRTRQRIVVIAIASVAMIAFLAWSISITIFNAQKLEGTLASYNVKSSQQVVVQVNLKRPENRAAYCQVEALAQNFEVVGYKQLAMPADQNSVSALLSTVKPAVSAVVKACWFK